MKRELKTRIEDCEERLLQLEASLSHRSISQTDDDMQGVVNEIADRITPDVFWNSWEGCNKDQIHREISGIVQSALWSHKKNDDITPD